MLPCTSKLTGKRLGATSFRQRRGVHSKRLQDVINFKEEFYAMTSGDPLSPVTDEKARAFFEKYGSIEKQFQLPNFVQCERNIWRDHELNADEATALKDIVSSLQKTHAKLLASYPSLEGIISRNESLFREATADLNPPIRVAVTGASGNIGYALLYRIAAGDVFGPRTPVVLQLLEIPAGMEALKGVEMELRDCAFPNIKDIIITDNADVAFADVDYALLVGAQPRTKGMERADLLQKNANIFSAQGKALNKVGKGKDTRVLVVGNPCNTNALIASRHAPKIPAENFAAMTKLDHNRGLAQLSEKLKCGVTDIKQFCIWGNHSATQFPDISYATVRGQNLRNTLNDEEWYKNTFIPCVQQRGAAIIKARGSSSAASAASSAMDNIREWHNGTSEWTSVAVCSNGEYGVEKGLFYSYPVTYSRQHWKVVPNLTFAPFAEEKMAVTLKELKEERDAIAQLLPRD